MYHVLLAEFRHETNTFSQVLTDLDRFKRRTYAVGEEAIRARFAGVHSEMGAFLQVMDGEEDICPLPVISANATPSGLVTDEMFLHVKDTILQAIRNTKQLDGVLLSLHGAMVTQSSEDGEGELLEAIRELVGPSIPIFATLDLHSNMTKKMALNANALFNYDEYPHADRFERGLEAAGIMVKTLRGQLNPVMRCAKKPLMLWPTPTEYPAMKELVRQMFAYEEDPKVITASISHGFFMADIEEASI